MIFIKNKKAWKEFLRGSVSNVVDSDKAPKEYPCFLELTGCNWHFEEREWEIIYKSDIESMLEKLENGREF